MGSARTIHGGPIASRTKETDGAFFIPGFDFMFPTGTWTVTRVAQGDIRMRKTAGAATTTPNINLTAYGSGVLKYGADPNWSAEFNTAPTTVPGDLTHDIRGFQVVSIDVVTAIATANLTSSAGTLSRTTYTKGAAPVVAALGGALAGSLTTTFNATNLNVDTLTPATPFILGNNLLEVAEWFEISVVDAGSSVYDLIGLWVKGNYNIL
jgi:hypothetical protein